MKHLYLTSIVLFLSLTSLAIGPITGPSTICVGGVVTLGDTSVGGTWSSSNIAIASINSAGVVAGVSAGTAIISYTRSGSYATDTITVSAGVAPNIYTMTAPGGSSYCAGGTGVRITLSASDIAVSYRLYSAGGSAGPSIFGTGSSIDFGYVSTPGNYYAVATAAGGCSINMSGTVTVGINPLPTRYVLTSGGSSTCAGTSGAHIILSGSQPGDNYQLFIGTSPIGAPIVGWGAPIDFGPPAASGTYWATGTDASTGCQDSMTGTAALTVIPPPGPIHGLTGVCLGSSITLSDDTTGGSWSSPAAGTIITIGSSSGIVTGVASGSAAITYTGHSGCTAVDTITVVTTVLPISTPPAFLCTALPDTLTDATPGGVWASSNPSVAPIGSTTGIVVGASGGTATISYTVGGSCGLVTRTVSMVVSPAPITGMASMCSGHSTTLTDVTGGGTWISDNTAVAAIGSGTGVITGFLTGTSTIRYVNSAGCSAVTVATVDSNAVITGSGSICALDSIYLTSSLFAGMWTSSNPAIARIGSYGAVAGINTGSAIISYTAYSTGCVSTHSVAVTSTCTGAPVAGTGWQSDTLVCPGAMVTFSVTGHVTACGTGFKWQSSPNGSTWTDLSTPYHNPISAMYYRGKSTCYSSGISTFTDTMHVSIHSYITSHSIINTPSYYCNGPQLQLTTCGYAPGMNVTTYFGDGTSTNTTLSSNYMSILHTYATPGIYTVKHVLYMGGAAIDSVTSSFTYYYCRTLPVDFYFDANSNCVYDAGDAQNSALVTTEVDSDGVAIDTVVAGWGFNYSVTGAPGTVYTFKILSVAGGLHVTCPSSGVLTDTIHSYVNDYAPLYFGLNCISSSNYDLAINANLYCGRHWADGYINVQNSYCTPVASTVTMNFSPKYTFTSSYPPPASVVGNTVTWNIAPLSTYNYPVVNPNISFHLDVPGTWLVTGDTVNANFDVTPYASDVDTINNYQAIVATVMSSYDPNEMSVTPQGKVIPCTQLRYTINFENTGNDTARNISVLDTLSPNLDPRSLALVSSTAATVISFIKDGGYNVAKFDFPHINLPDSGRHTYCTGMLTFNIRTKPGLSDGTLISNAAGIYFDDNPVVMTNAVTNTIGLSPITGPDSLCNAATILLADATASGIWGRTNTNASVSSGMVTAMAAGRDTINYTVSNSCTSRAVSKEIAINPVLVPSVVINNPAGTGDTVCGSAATNFYAISSNGGSTPLYEWAVNGAVAGTGTSYSYMPANGDIIAITLTSNATCAVPATITVKDTLTVLPALIPVVNITTSPGVIINPGTTVTFTASVINGGTSPSYQWLVNNAPVSGATTAVYVTNSLNDGDSISCIVISNGECGGYPTFNSIDVTVTVTGVKAIAGGEDFTIHPNPNKGDFIITGTLENAADEEVTMELSNVVGAVVYEKKIASTGGKIRERIVIDKNIGKGVYLLNVRSSAGGKVIRMIIE